jgi:Zn-dependent peptidase ImmA (M78 family)
MSGRGLARWVIDNFATNDPEVIAQKEGLELIWMSLPRRYWDILIAEFVVIRDDLSPAWQRWCLAHCLGHHFMHHGNQFRLREWSNLISARRVQEAEAEVFTARLLMPEDELQALKNAAGKSLDIWQIAEHFNVPVEMVPFRLGIGENPYLRSIGW